MGSPKSWKKMKCYNRSLQKKKIIKIFDTRTDAELFERKLIMKFIFHNLNRNYMIPVVKLNNT